MTNEVYAPSVQTLDIETGNVATVNDVYNSSLVGSIYPNFGARNPVGQPAYISDGPTGASASLSATAPARRWKVRYVRLNSTAAPTLIVGPVYWKDNTFQVVTAVESEGLFGLNSVAGILLNKNATNGNYVFILVSGHLGASNLGGVVVPAGTGVGDALIGASGNQVFGRIASGSNITNKVVAWAETAVTNYVSDILVCAEELGV